MLSACGCRLVDAQRLVLENPPPRDVDPAAPNCDAWAGEEGGGEPDSVLGSATGPGLPPGTDALHSMGRTAEHARTPATAAARLAVPRLLP